MIIVTAVAALLFLAMYVAAQTIIVNGIGDLQARIWYFLLLSIAIALAMAFAAVFLIEKIGISLMYNMDEAIRRIRDDNDLSVRIPPVTGNDEVSHFAKTINETLEALEMSRRQLKESEEKYRRLVENVNDIVWETDGDIRFTYVSPQIQDVMGYEPGEIAGRSPFELMEADEEKQIVSLIVDQIGKRGRFDLVRFTATRRDGTMADLEISGAPIPGQGGRAAWYRGIIRDIGERKRAEEALLESEERLRLCMATARLGVFDWDVTNDRHLWSPETYEIYGIPPGTMLTLDRVRECICKEDLQNAIPEFAIGLTWPDEYSTEYRIIRTPDHAVRWVYVMARVFFVGEGAERRVVRVLGAIQDITERKHAEEMIRKINDELEARVLDRTADLEEANEALRESESRYRDLVQNANSMIIRFGMSGRITFFNEFACSFFGYSKDEIIGKSVLETIFPPAESSGRDLSKHMRDLLWHPDRHVINVNENLRRDGERVWVSWTNKAVTGQDGCIEEILAIGNDITDLKRASEELQRINNTLEDRVQQRTAELASAVKALQDEIAERRRVEQRMMSSLQEKEVLLKEIHHRVKNNLQIISSLLSLQSEKIGSENPAKTFQESQDRIRSMALVHEKLYQARDISHVDFAEYVRSLTAYLSRSYVTRSGIEVVIDIEGVSLGIDTAIPCGLIINELVSNSLKYAFKDDRTGVVHVSLSKRDDTYTLIVSDNGTGLPPEIDFRNTFSLGLQLVNTLVSQLEGTIEQFGDSGTTFRMIFRENPQENVTTEPSGKS